MLIQKGSKRYQPEISAWVNSQSRVHATTRLPILNINISVKRSSTDHCEPRLQCCMDYTDIVNNTIDKCESTGTPSVPKSAARRKTVKQLIQRTRIEVWEYHNIRLIHLQYYQLARPSIDVCWLKSALQETLVQNTNQEWIQRSFCQ